MSGEEDSPRANKPLLGKCITTDDESDTLVVHSINNPRVDVVGVSTTRLQNAPEDTFNFNYIVFYFLGMTSILPWNFIMMAEEYWLFKFRNVTGNGTDLTPRQMEMQADLSMSSAIPSTAFLIINAIIGYRFSLKSRIICSYVVMTLLMVLTTIFVKIDTDTWQDEFFVITIATVVVINSASAVASGTLFGIAGQFPSEYMTAVVSGQALGGIFAALAEIIIITFHPPPDLSAFIYFIIGSTALLVSIILYLIMQNTFCFKYFIMHQQMARSNSSRELLTAHVGSEIHQPSFKTVMGKIWVYGFSEWLVFATTLAIYPSVTVLVNSEHKGNGHLWNDIYFVPVVNYLLFNSGDYLGRIFAGLFEKPQDKPFVVAFLTIARILFIPLLALCNTKPRHSLPVLFHSDSIFILLMSGLAVSNGYLANIAMICAPKIVREHEKEMASSIMAAFLGVGLAGGSMISFLLVELI
uniref:CSON012193 protein n=1 Tax=Culicoides sonorensis TaxID=179676 RepID=A0A336MAB6_CULSO